MLISDVLSDVLPDALLAQLPVLLVQLALLSIIFLVPLLLLKAAQSTDSVFMLFDTLSHALLPWNWSDSSSSSSDKRKAKKKHSHAVRTRAEQLAANAPNGHAPTQEDDVQLDALATNDGYYPGLVNISGTYCFMNSTLQAMASLAYLQPYIHQIHAKAEALDVPTPVIDAFRDILIALNTAHSAPRAIRPIDIISALSNNSPSKHNSLFSSREHQDAQELFQLLSECVKRDAAAVDRERARDRGLGAFSEEGRAPLADVAKSVFDGLTANRRSCVECGYTEAVMHFAFDSWQLAVPRLASTCRLEDCLDDYTRLELLTDCVCRKCSLLATHRRLLHEADRLTVELQQQKQQNEDDAPSASKKKRAREARKLVARVEKALEEGRVEEDIKGVKVDRVISKVSTKQAMIARPPPVLVLHLNRSMHTAYTTSKNTCKVLFPEVLDLTPYTTSGQLSTVPSVPISSPAPRTPSSPSSSSSTSDPSRSTTPTPPKKEKEKDARILYRLSAVVCHYGAHSFGHYVAFRRRPPITLPSLQHQHQKQRAGSGWLRVSDDVVRECGVEEVLKEGSGAFMIFYERIGGAGPAPEIGASSSSSHEAARPYAFSAASRLSVSSTSPSVSVSPAPVAVPSTSLSPIPSPGSSPPARTPLSNGNGNVVYGSSTPRSSEETLRPPGVSGFSRIWDADANGSCVSLASVEGEKRGVGARVVRNVSVVKGKGKGEVNGVAAEGVNGAATEEINGSVSKGASSAKKVGAMPPSKHARARSPSPSPSPSPSTSPSQHRTLASSPPTVSASSMTASSPAHRSRTPSQSRSPSQQQQQQQQQSSIHSNPPLSRTVGLKA